MVLLKIVAFLAILSPIFGAKNSTNLFFNGTSSILALEKPFKVDIYQFSSDPKQPKPKVVASFVLPNATEATVSGTVTPSKGDSIHVLDIKYNGEIMGTNGTLTSAELSFEMTYRRNTR
jgi:hypothetical protein